MKKWVQKFISQFETSDEDSIDTSNTHISEEKATILFVIDTLSKYLIDIENYPSRQVRTSLEEIAHEMIKHEGEKAEKAYFRFRQYFSSHRISEYAYLQKTFDDFRNIIWDFVEQLIEDLETEQSESDLKNHFEELKEAVEANSIDTLKKQSRQFIDSYIEYQYRKEEKKNESINKFKKNITSIKQKLIEANQSVNIDHLTGAFNRKAFDEHIKKQWQLHKLSNGPTCLVILDIDHFKKVNDNYGHAVGDCIIKECVRLLQGVFNRDRDFVARIGGEEFAVVMTDTNIVQAIHKAEKCLDIIRKETFVDGEMKIKFTVSMGIAQLNTDEYTDSWFKRADEALYYSKNNGRNRLTASEHEEKVDKVS